MVNNHKIPENNNYTIVKYKETFYGRHKAQISVIVNINESAYEKKPVTNKDQPVHAAGMTRVLLYPTLDSPEAVEGACGSEMTLIRLRGCAG